MTAAVDLMRRHAWLPPFVVLLAALLIPFAIMANTRRAERRVRRRRSAA